jgi:sn-glycerol 3-phosphate transport system substrate-binding protein
LGEAEQGVVDSFNSAQSEVKVTLQPHASYEEVAQKLTAALQAQTPPDIALLSDVWWFKFYTAQALAPLNELMTAQDVDRNDYVDVLLNEGVRNDTVYWIPFARSTPLFYYNKEAWAKAGLPDRGPETWDEFQEWAPKLMTEVNGQPRSAFAHPSAASYIAWLFQGVIWQFGGSYSDPDFTVRITEPNATRAAQFYGDTVHNFKWATTPKDINQDFVTGLTASMMASTGGLLSIVKNAPFEVGTAFLPEQDAFGCPTGGAGLAIMAASPTEKQQAAMRYIAFVTGTEGATSWSQATGYMPVRKSAVESAGMQEFFTQNPNFKTAVDQLPKTKPQDVARVYIPGGDQIIGKGLEQITVAGGEVEPALADVAKTLSEEAKPVIEAVRAIEG